MAVWLKGQVMDALDRRDAAFEKLTNEELVIWQKDRRAFFRAANLAVFPKRTPLNAKVTERMAVDDYRIEKLYFESQPGLHVTATLYLPKDDGPFPAVLHPTGHSPQRKEPGIVSAGLYCHRQRRLRGSLLRSNWAGVNASNCSTRLADLMRAPSNIR